ncbi:MAG: RCC1 domain-containing protein [Solirubrobacterales bacterium]
MTHFSPTPHAVAQRLLLAVLTALTALLMFQSSASANGGALTPEIATGGAHTCALADSGKVKCWGDNSSGQLGGGVTAFQGGGETPKPATLSRATTVVASADATCVLSEDSSIWCWGSNAYGELGLGAADAVAHPTPAQIPGSKDFSMLAAGANHFCASTWNGEVSCWGSNAQGQLGNGSVGGLSAVPVKVGGVTKLKSLTAGANFTCANRETTKVACWGADDKGQLGSGAAGASSGSAVEVPNLKDSYYLVAGANHVCSLGWSETALRCWGDNLLGQLAQGTLGETAPRGVSNVTGLAEVKVLGGNANSGCATAHTVTAATNSKVSKDSALQCWGELTASGLPRVVPLAEVASLSQGSSSSSQCAIVRGGSSYCWGAGGAPGLVAGLDLVTKPQYPNWAYLEPTSKLRLNKSGTAWRIRSRLKVEPSSFIFPKAACKGTVAADAFYYKRVAKKSAQAAGGPVHKRVGVRTRSRLRLSGDYCKADFLQTIPLSKFAGKKRKLVISATGFGNAAQSKFQTGDYELKNLNKKKK